MEDPFETISLGTVVRSRTLCVYEVTCILCNNCIKTLLALCLAPHKHITEGLSMPVRVEDWRHCQ